MAPTRRPRGSVVDPKPLAWRVTNANKEYFSALADKAGITSAALFDLMVERLTLDDRGLPDWYPRDDEEGKLPIE